MAKEKILIVEDDRNISKLVKYNLEKENCDCNVAVTGEEALEILNKREINLIILDIMLPETDGFEVCRLIKQNENLRDIPIIMLTAKGEEVDRIVGFELGADDYIVKPFSPRELVLRVKAILRRGKDEGPEKEILTAGSLIVDIARHKVTTGQKEIELTPMEFKLLVTLMKRRGRVQSRDRLLNDVWGMDAGIYTRTTDAHIKKLREKLGKSKNLIETVSGLGYKFKEED